MISFQVLQKSILSWYKRVINVIRRIRPVLNFEHGKHFDLGRVKTWNKKRERTHARCYFFLLVIHNQSQLRGTMQRIHQRFVYCTSVLYLFNNCSDLLLDHLMQLVALSLSYGGIIFMDAFLVNNLLLLSIIIYYRIFVALNVKVKKRSLVDLVRMRCVDCDEAKMEVVPGKINKQT